MGHLIDPISVRDTVKSGMGCHLNRCLHGLVESVSVNAGGLRAEVSSPSMKYASVGGVIVRAWQHASQAG
jgi:hypothetical protein